MQYVFRTDEFTKEVKKALSDEEYRNLDSFLAALAEGKIRGKVLRIPWLWELKLPSKRLYFVVQNDVILFVAASKKNRQEQEIKRLVERKAEFCALTASFKPRG